jgi:HlyD family secretion protein
VAQLESDLSKALAARDRLQQKEAALERLVATQAATANELAQNKLELQQAEADVNRLEQNKKDMARLSQVQAQQARLRVQQMQDEARDLEQKISSSRVVAPTDGTVYSLPVHPRDYVRLGAPMIAMADLRRVRVRAYVDEPDLGGLEANDPVEVTWGAMPNKVWTGETEQIPKQVVARLTRSVGEVVCSVSNERGELIPGTNVDVRIRVRHLENVLVVPRAAVHGEGNNRFVFVAQDGRLRKQSVQLGVSSTAKYEVASGLKDGDMVALPGTLDLKDGMEVRAVEQP